jgi:hypothetical protein
MLFSLLGCYSTSGLLPIANQKAYLVSAMIRGALPTTLLAASIRGMIGGRKSQLCDLPRAD